MGVLLVSRDVLHPAPYHRRTCFAPSTIPQAHVFCTQHHTTDARVLHPAPYHRRTCFAPSTVGAWGPQKTHVKSRFWASILKAGSDVKLWFTGRTALTPGFEPAPWARTRAASACAAGPAARTSWTHALQIPRARCRSSGSAHGPNRQTPAAPASPHHLPAR